MNILFISPNGFEANHTLQIHNLANALEENGIKCSVLVPANSFKCYQIHSGKVLYQPFSFDEFNYYYEKLDPDIIHCWTPRENVRLQTSLVKKKYSRAKVIIHLEDNENFLSESYHKYPIKFLKNFNKVVLKRILLPNLSHPIFSHNFLNDSDGVTGIISTLKDFCPSIKPFFELWPIFEDDRPNQIFSNLGTDTAKDDSISIAYTGNVHDANFNEVVELYEGILNASKKGVNVKLYRAGVDSLKIRNILTNKFCGIEKYLGYLSRNECNLIQFKSNILIQPGQNDLFNKYRLPSKIPEFLLSGRPTALPESNIANHLSHRFNAIILKKGNRIEIENLILDYVKRPDFYNRIGIEGKKFAQKYFSSSYILNGIISFYNQILSEKI